MKRFLMLLAGLLFSSLTLAAININTATLQELAALNGIGSVKAQAIIDHRKANGPFKSVDQLKDVKGIGDATFDKIKADVSVSGVSAPAAKAAPVTTPPAASAAPMKAEAAKAVPAAPAMSAKEKAAMDAKAVKVEKVAKDKAAADEKAAKDKATADAKAKK